MPETEFVEVEKYCRKAKRSATDRLSEELSVKVIAYTLARKRAGMLSVLLRAAHHGAGEATEDYSGLSDHCGAPQNGVWPPQLQGQTRPCFHPEGGCASAGNSRSFVCAETAAHIMAQKFVISVPLCRQEQEFLRSDIFLFRQTMSNWLFRCAEDRLERSMGG